VRFARGTILLTLLGDRAALVARLHRIRDALLCNIRVSLAGVLAEDSWSRLEESEGLRPTALPRENCLSLQADEADARPIA